MRAKSDIIAYLESQLSDDIWKKLQNSLLGRELLAFGAEVISENENVKDTMLLQMNPETADKNGLYMLSQMNEIPITNIKPSTLVVQMVDTVKTYAPYELQYNIGNVHFTNIEYTMQGKSVSLINGTHKCYAVGMDRSADSVEDGSETFFYDGTTTYSGIKLGNAYPDSIVVEYRHKINDDESQTEYVTTEMNRYSSDIALSNSATPMYKVITGVDGNIYIRFFKGDDTTYNPETYKIDWLDHSAMEFEVDDLSVKDGNVTVGEIVSQLQGSEDDLDFMRLQIKKEMAKYNGLNTPKSIESYVEGFPYVIDSKCVSDKSGGLCVYVKPTETFGENIYLDFSEIASHISLNSVLFPNTKVTIGRQLDFSISVSGIADNGIRNNVKNMIQETYAYDKMGFDSTVNVSQVLADIYSKFGIVPSVKMMLKEKFRNNEPLCYVPIKNSVRGYDTNGIVTMVENDGVLYGKTTTEDKLMSAYNVLCCIGTMMVLVQNKMGYENDSIDYNNTGETLCLYDVSKNMIKPYTDVFKKMIESDKNPSLKTDAWSGYWDNDNNYIKQDDLIKLTGIETLSVNNGVIYNLIYYKNFGEDEHEEKITDNEWNMQNGRHPTCYNFFDGDKNYDLEKFNGYKKKYQYTFCIKDTNSFKNFFSSDNQNYGMCGDGVPDYIEGFYDGYKGYIDGKREIKSNGFYFENYLYYMSSISNTQVVVKCYDTGQKINVPIATKPKGMVERNGVLYVIQEKNITVVDGFSGVKQKSVIYSVYKNNIESFKIDGFVNGLDGTMLIRSDNVIYHITGFEINNSIIILENLTKVFDNDNITPFNNDGSIELPEGNDYLDNITIADCVIGSCTSEYATCYYKEINSNFNKNYFYCYDLKQKKTTCYKYFCKIAFNQQIGYYIDTNVDTGFIKTTIVGGDQSVVGFIDYPNNSIVNDKGIDVDTVEYEGLTAYGLTDTYLKLKDVNFS